MSLKDEQLIIFDGAVGSNIAEMSLPDSVWNERYMGYSDYLNLSAPEVVTELHLSFLEAGSDVIETNTFGANGIVAAEYGLEKEVDKINRLAVENAKKAVAGNAGKYIAGSVGPTTKLPSLGHIAVDDMAMAYSVQMRALVEAGVDCIIIETSQDLLQLKTALVTAFEVLEQVGVDIPVLVSATMESTGTMLVGSNMGAVVTTLEPFPIFSLGLNCATGPAEMESHVAYLSRIWPGRISVIPNAGIPEVIGDETIFPLAPVEFAARLTSFVERFSVSIVGGCCGTTPEHIRCLKESLSNITFEKRDIDFRPSLASLFGAVEISQEIPPLMVGERMNANGSKKFRKHLLQDDFEGAVDIGRKQEMKGAHILDLCCAYAGRDEQADLSEMVARLSGAVKAPLVIDSTSPDAIEAALKILGGRAVVNSINLEDGGKNLKKVCKTVKKYGAAVVALTIGPDGMAMTTGDKIKVAKEIHHRAVNEHGLRVSDIFFDLLTFTIGSGDPSLNNAAVETLDGIRQIKKELPGSFTILGVSNISFGLPRYSRKVLNSIFLHEAIQAGLDAAIVDAGNVLPVASISKEERELSLDLIYNREGDQGESPLETFIAHFEGQKKSGEDREEEQKQLSPEQQTEAMVLDGEKEHLEDVLSILLERYTPLEVVNQILVPAMRRVGYLFGRGEMLLPFVLKSAEVMKRGVDYLEPFMEQLEAVKRVVILLATVQGDVHDIGKNLVDIILSNNGFEVINIGINVPTETIIQKAIEHKVDAIGLSGLLVKSALRMKESMPLFKSYRLDVPILLGGAALTPRFVCESCVPAYDAPVVYCSDAFAGLNAMQELEAGTLRSTRLPDKPNKDVKAGEQEGSKVLRNNQVPPIPFLGARYVEDIDPALLFDLVNKQALFRGRWGYRKAKMSEGEYAKFVEEKVEPIFVGLKERFIAEKLAMPKVAYGYFNCFVKGDSLFVQDEAKTHRFDLPRQGFGSRLSMVDYFKTENEGGDVVGFFVATLGDRVASKTRALFEGDEFHDYLILHGFAVEMTDALAEYWHAVMGKELGIGAIGPTGSPACSCQGTRYGFGYPSCPDLGAHETVFKLLDPSKIGVTLTESMEMVPEVSTSAIVVHHPQATYFSV